MRGPCLLLAALVLVPGCTVGGDGRGEARAATLTPERTRVAWEGEQFGGGRGGGVLGSDQFVFEVALGEGYWERRPGSVHVGIQWTERGKLAHEATGDMFGIQVKGPDGLLLAATGSSRRDISAAQSVDIGPVEDGRYTITVLPERVRDASYEGVVLLRPARRGELLPDLVPEQPTSFVYNAEGPSGPAGAESCQEGEKAAIPGLERCLRFDATLTNIGSGPFVVEADITEAVEGRDQAIAAGAEPDGAATQVVRSADGSQRRIPTGRWVIDREHAHTHIVDLAVLELHRVDDGGDRTLMVTDHKIGFCPWDIIDRSFGEPGGAARRYPAQACHVPTEPTSGEPVLLEMGISAGWADVYPARRPWQYLDVTGVPDGVYDVVVRVDPNGWFEEADRSNNEAATRIRLAGDSITCIPRPYGCPDHATA